jgi:hypothetical protein
MDQGVADVRMQIHALMEWIAEHKVEAKKARCTHDIGIESIDRASTALREIS